MALNQALPVLLNLPQEELGGINFIRRAAFLLIIVAVISKNLKHRPKT